jgi:hypothetical protein
MSSDNGILKYLLVLYLCTYWHIIISFYFFETKECLPLLGFHQSASYCWHRPYSGAKGKQKSNHIERGGNYVIQKANFYFPLIYWWEEEGQLHERTTSQ